MKSDGPMLLAVLFLAAGLFVIFDYGVGTAAFNAAYPLSGASLQLSIATAGPAAMAGLALVTVGVLFLVLALLCAIVGLFQPVASYRDGSSRLAVTRLNLGDHQEAREERWKASYPKE
jgi:hypothetical protein